MCIHPEALTQGKNFSPTYDNKCHTFRQKKDVSTPSKAQWAIRQTNYPSNKREKFCLKAETELPN